MERETLVRYLKSACKTVFAEHFSGKDRIRIEEAVDAFFNEGIAHYSDVDLLDLFTPPKKGFDLFSDYLEAMEATDKRTSH